MRAFWRCGDQAEPVIVQQAHPLGQVFDRWGAHAVIIIQKDGTRSSWTRLPNKEGEALDYDPPEVN
jgi:hypothetical protein